jgi:hypothetical protein
MLCHVDQSFSITDDDILGTSIRVDLLIVLALKSVFFTVLP